MAKAGQSRVARGCRVKRSWRPNLYGLGFALTWSSLVVGSAQAEGKADDRTVYSRAVHVRDVAQHCFPAVCPLVVGNAPPPGSSALFTTARIERIVRGAGHPKDSVRMPRDVRVESAAARLSTKQWAAVASAHLEGALPAGLRLKSTDAKMPVVLPAQYALGGVSLPIRPRTVGAWRTTAMIEILHDGKFLRKVPVVAELTVTNEAVRPHIRRGNGLTLVVERRAASISMQGVAMKDAEVGSILPCRVVKTGRVVRARLRSASLAEVVEAR